MADKLIHSMSYYAEIFDVILPSKNPRTIVEIGSEYGGSTKYLASYAQRTSAHLYVIDPAPKVDLDLALEGYKGSYSLIKENSLAALPKISGDIYFVDGDHNYWTVSNELAAIYNANPDAWVVLHDVGMPCGRRDFYYNPNSIPEHARHKYSYDYGVNLQTGDIEFENGFIGNGEFAIALESGTPRNGVLTAIEDCIQEHPELYYTSIPLIFGLGFIMPKENAEFLNHLLKPYQGQLAKLIESNRLELYNEVLRLNKIIPITKTRKLINKILDAIGIK